MTIAQGYSNQKSIVLSQKQTHRSMEKNRELKKKIHVLTVNQSMINEARIYNGEKMESSINGARKTGHLHVKE